MHRLQDLQETSGGVLLTVGDLKETGTRTGTAAIGTEALETGITMVRQEVDLCGEAVEEELRGECAEALWATCPVGEATEPCGDSLRRTERSVKSVYTQPIKFPHS